MRDKIEEDIVRWPYITAGEGMEGCNCAPLQMLSQNQSDQNKK